MIDQDLTAKHRSTRVGAFVFLFWALVLIDQGSKQLAINVFYNYNFAFSLPLPLWVMYVIYFVVLGWLIYFFIKNFYKVNTPQRLAFIFILAGAFSNVGERLIFGRVLDFIYVSVRGLTGIYNLADGFILLGMVLLLCYGLTTNEQNLE